MKVIELMMLLVGAAGSALAGEVVAAPEIDSASAIGALALLSGSLLVIRSRRRKQ
jgi:LPXTG-motif cell wall-anchored protein